MTNTHSDHAAIKRVPRRLTPMSIKLPQAESGTSSVKTGSEFPISRAGQTSYNSLKVDGLFDNFWTSRVSNSMDKRNFGSRRYVFEVQFGRLVAIERKWESSEGNFTRTKAKIGVKIRRIRCFREL